LTEAVLADVRFSDKQLLFVEAYLQCWNATEAARRAGYKNPRQMGHETLSKPYIREEIDTRLDVMTMKSDEILIRLTAQARATIEDFFQIDRETGLGFLDLRKAQTFQQLGVIKKLKIKRGKEIEIELYDAQTALMNLAKLRGMVKEQVEVSWRKEAEEAGINPSDLFEQLVQHAAATLASRNRTIDGGSVDHGSAPHRNGGSES
jgi:hypothetical protein